jgi:hypothetical protein
MNNIYEVFWTLRAEFQKEILEDDVIEKLWEANKLIWRINQLEKDIIEFLWEK